jgi:flagellar basal-body rod modification protein FlgD
MQIQHTTQNQALDTIAPDTSVSTPSTTTASSSSDPTSLANEDTFLQLMVAQLKNQDPDNPIDGTQFLSQLAQFSQLEQLININADLQPQTSSSSTTSGNTSGGTNGASAV